MEKDVRWHHWWWKCCLVLSSFEQSNSNVVEWTDWSNGGLCSSTSPMLFIVTILILKYLYNYWEQQRLLFVAIQSNHSSYPANKPQFQYRLLYNHCDTVLFARPKIDNKLLAKTERKFDLYQNWIYWCVCYYASMLQTTGQLLNINQCAIF